MMTTNNLVDRLSSLPASGLPDDLASPEWFRPFEDCHDWKSHIPGELRRLWAELSHESRLALFVVAQKLADDEEWE